MKFTFSSTVVKPERPSGNDALHPIPQHESASATTVAACRKPLGARNSGLRSMRASTCPLSTTSSSMPKRPGSVPSICTRSSSGTCRSAVVLDCFDGDVEAVHLRRVAERAEEVLEALEVVVQAQPPDVDDRHLVVRDAA